MTDQPTERQPLRDPEPGGPDEQPAPYVIEPQLPTDEDGERIYPQDAPREGDGDPSVTGTIEEVGLPIKPIG